MILIKNDAKVQHRTMQHEKCVKFKQIVAKIRYLWRKTAIFVAKNKSDTYYLDNFSLFLKLQNIMVSQQKPSLEMKNTSINIFHRILVTVVFSLAISFAYAQQEVSVYSFLGGGNNALWSNVDNWDGGLKPTNDSLYTFVFINTANSEIILDEDVNIEYLSSNYENNLTLQGGKILTVNDTIIWSHGNIIIEDRAQLVYNASIPASVRKNISAYDAGTHQWNLIASPITDDVLPSLENGILTDPESAYALYTFNEENREWISYKETPFVISNKHGYLYANAFDTTLVFDGFVRSASTPVEVNLSYHATNNFLAGCNLLGNPFSCNAFVDKSYYILSENSNTLIAVALSSHTPITPCMGIIVKAREAFETVTFCHEMPQPSEHHGYIEITAAKSNAQNLILDQATISFNSGDDLSKFALYEDAPNIFFTKDNHDLAILSIDSVDIQPIKFKAAEDGSYTLHFEPKDLNLNYLHLIDNMTGSNIDLLVTPDYSFIANANDYASRFKLVFDPHYGIEEHANEKFAYYANGEIQLIMETQSRSSLQIIDMTGRVIIKRDAINRVSTNGIAPGVYILRLETPNGVRTQKLAIQ